MNQEQSKFKEQISPPSPRIHSPSPNTNLKKKFETLLSRICGGALKQLWHSQFHSSIQKLLPPEEEKKGGGDREGSVVSDSQLAFG